MAFSQREEGATINYVDKQGGRVGHQMSTMLYKGLFINYVDKILKIFDSLPLTDKHRHLAYPPPIYVVTKISPFQYIYLKRNVYSSNANNFTRFLYIKAHGIFLLKSGK